MASRNLLVTGYVRPAADGGLVQVTGGTIYDYRVALHFRERGWNVSYCHFVCDFPRVIHSSRFLVNLAMMLRYRRSSLDLVLADEGGHQQTWLFNRWARRRKGARVLMIVHHLRCRTISNPVWRALTVPVERLMLRSADLLVANSRHTISEIGSLGLPTDDVLLAPPGLSVEGTGKPRIRDNVRRILMVGNVVPRKGTLDAVEALSAAGACSDAELVIVGRTSSRPEYYESVVSLVRERGLTSRVTFTGQVSQERLEELYSISDLFVLPSYWEGYGMVIAEAMARGLPVLTTSAGAITELVEDGVTGLVVSAGDTAALSEGLSRLCSDYELRSRLAEAAYRTSCSFPTWEETCHLIYGEAMSGFSGSSPVQRKHAENPGDS